MSAMIIPFPFRSAAIVTVKRITLGPAKEPRPYWHLPWLEGQRGWAPTICHPNGTEDVVGFHRYEATARQQAEVLAARRGFRLISHAVAR